MSSDCKWYVLPRGALGWSAVCDCGYSHLFVCLFVCLV